MVWRPDGTVDHLVRVLDGMMLTQRVQAPLACRTELWATVSLQHLLNIATFAPLPLAHGSGSSSSPSSATWHGAPRSPRTWSRGTTATLRVDVDP
jgi:hypothetical protein